MATRWARPRGTAPGGRRLAPLRRQRDGRKQQERRRQERAAPPASGTPAPGVPRSDDRQTPWRTSTRRRSSGSPRPSVRVDGSSLAEREIGQEERHGEGDAPRPPRSRDRATRAAVRHSPRAVDLGQHVGGGKRREVEQVVAARQVLRDQRRRGPGERARPAACRSSAGRRRAPAASSATTAPAGATTAGSGRARTRTAGRR